jgi:hypothetical protein
VCSNILLIVGKCVVAVKFSQWVMALTRLGLGGKTENQAGNSTGVAPGLQDGLAANLPLDCRVSVGTLVL